MASNFFGNLFRITTFGESHGPCIGVVIDGCPALVPISQEQIQQALDQRRPGNTPYTSPRKESDAVQILSGIFEGKTTGAPITLLIPNHNADSSAYSSLKDLYRPGHANFTYLEKYGIFDHRGGGRASARETAARVAAGSVAKQFLSHFQIECCAFLSTLGPIQAAPQDLSIPVLRSLVLNSPLFCPDENATAAMAQALHTIQEEKDSLGGIVSCVCHLPSGLGDPIYAKLEALLASAMLSIPASKGFEIGAGFAAASMKGSEHNDLFEIDTSNNILTTTNHSGGVLGGISTGAPLFFRVPFKPTSSIKKSQQTLNLAKEKALLEQPENARHDPCVAIRAVPVVEAMAALVLADCVLMNRCGKLC